MPPLPEGAKTLQLSWFMANGDGAKSVEPETKLGPEPRISKVTGKPIKPRAKRSPPNYPVEKGVNGLRLVLPGDLGEKCELLASYGVPVKVIARVVGLGESTVSSRFGK